MKKFWLAVSIGALVILGFAIWVQFYKDTNCFAEWVLDFLTQWSNVLSATVTITLAIAAFWVISDTRRFRYLDDKTKTIIDLSNWGADVVRCLTIPARQVNNVRELKKNLVDCRTELTIKIAQSIGIFATARKLSSDVHIKEHDELKKTIDSVDKAIRAYITTLFDVDIEKATAVETDRLVDESTEVAAKTRILLEAASKI